MSLLHFIDHLQRRIYTSGRRLRIDDAGQNIDLKMLIQQTLYFCSPSQKELVLPTTLNQN